MRLSLGQISKKSLMVSTIMSNIIGSPSVARGGVLGDSGEVAPLSSLRVALSFVNFIFFTPHNGSKNILILSRCFPYCFIIYICDTFVHYTINDAKPVGRLLLVVSTHRTSVDHLIDFVKKFTCRGGNVYLGMYGHLDPWT